MKAFLAMASILGSFSAFAQQRNQLLILSGGSSPAGNHYSQYLQTKTMADNLSQRLNYDVQVLFGAGHQTASSAPYADVHKIEKGNVAYSKFIVGAIQNNQPATKQNVLSYFKNETQPNLRNFFLLVSDHGMPNRANNQSDMTFSNNCIDLWSVGMKGDSLVDLGNFQSARCLSKNELKAILRDQVSAQRKVFAMSQCFSGGFHQMSVSETGDYPQANPNVCGFTAITHDSWASGCSPDVDGPSYQGYERSFTEQLTGYDYVNHKQIRPPRWSFQEAHENAILEDMTVDIPLATSEYYLWRWSEKMKQDGFVPRVDVSEMSVQNSLFDGEHFQHQSKDKEFHRKNELYQKMIHQIQKQFPQETMDLSADMAVLERAVRDLKSQMQDVDQKIAQLSTDVENTFQNVVFQSWLNQQINGWSLPETEKNLETELVRLDQSTQHDGERIYSTYHLPILWKTNPELAKVHSLYLQKRSQYMAQMALKNASFETIAEIEAMNGMKKAIDRLSEDSYQISKLHGLHRRVLIYRQALGAWAALETMKDQAALTELSGLLLCEKTRLN